MFGIGRKGVYKLQNVSSICLIIRNGQNHAVDASKHTQNELLQQIQLKKTVITFDFIQQFQWRRARIFKNSLISIHGKWMKKIAMNRDDERFLTGWALLFSRLDKYLWYVNICHIAEWKKKTRISIISLRCN